MTVETQAKPSCQGKFGTRHRQLMLSFLALVIYGLQGSGLSIAIVAMTHSTSNSSSSTFDYSIRQKGVLMGIFGYGYTVGNVLFGYLADHYGPMKISPIAAGICGGLLSFAFPSSAQTGFEFGCGMRALQGFLMSCVYPCVYVHMSKWVVPQEQADFSWIWTGHQVGSLIISTLAGPLANSTTGWPLIFYFSGGMSVLWGLFTLVWGANCPADHQSIPMDEKNYIESNLIGGLRNSKVKTPWLEMLKSKPLWAFLIVQTCDWYGGDAAFSFEPTYLNGVFNLTVDEAALAKACNYLLCIPASFLFTYLAMKTDQRVSVNFTRKVWTTVGMYGDALALFLLAVLPQRSSTSIILFALAIVLNAATHPGYMTNILDIAPNFAGTIAGSLTTLTNMVSSCAPIMTGFLLHDEADVQSWRKVFFFSGAVYALGNTVFLIFGSTDAQSWNNEVTELEPDVPNQITRRSSKKTRRHSILG